MKSPQEIKMCFGIGRVQGSQLFFDFLTGSVAVIGAAAGQNRQRFLADSLSNLVLETVNKRADESHARPIHVHLRLKGANTAAVDHIHEECFDGIVAVMGKGCFVASQVLSGFDHGAFLQLRAAGAGDASVRLRVKLENVIDWRFLRVILQMPGSCKGFQRRHIYRRKAHIQMNAHHRKFFLIVSAGEVAVAVQRIQQESRVLAAGEPYGNAVAVRNEAVIQICLMNFSDNRAHHSVLIIALRSLIMGRDMNGILLLNKPRGLTSFAAVSRVRHLFHEKKAGHTGTLDPQAEGLLIVLLGSRTKLASFAQKDHKRYCAEFCFGLRTDTEDIYGRVLEKHDPRPLSLEEVQAAAGTFLGDIQQVPPMYSALHQDGKKLYELAREGIQVERQPRRVHVDALQVEKLAENRWRLEAEVSSGTYIRSLIRDLGEKVGEDAVMTALTRTGIGSLDLSMAQTLEEMAAEPRWLAVKDVIDPVWEMIEEPAGLESAVANGRAVKLSAASRQVILMQGDDPLAAYQIQEDGLYHCVRGLR